MIEVELWNKAQEHLRNSLPENDFDLWISPLRPKSLENGLLTIEVPNRFHAEWIKKNVKRQLLNLLGGDAATVTEMDFVWAENLIQKDRPFVLNIQADESSSGASRESTVLGAKYTFERFVVGPTNRFAHAASVSVSQMPGKQFNPLFIYGSAGLGKTHLLHAIGHAALKNYPKKSVLHLNAETFVNEYINALKNKQVDAYRDRYRRVDYLLIDDIQFLVGKEQSEQEFFHTFNALIDLNSQIVLTSDRAPKDLQPLETRLISRMEWGVVADIKPPDFETRLAILRKKCELESVTVPDDILQQLAQSVRMNIRVLEGCLNSLIAYCCLTGSPMNMETAEQILRQIKEEIPKEYGATPTISLIQEVVAKNYNIEVADFKDKSRSANKVLPRQIAIYLARSMTNRSLKEIGRAFGGKDHSTVLHASNKINRMAKTDPYIAKFLNKIEEEINKTLGI